MKEFLNLEVAASLGAAVAASGYALDQTLYMDSVKPDYEALAVKARAFRIAAGFKASLPDDFKTALAILIKSLPAPFETEDNIANNGFRFWPIASFIEAYGLEDLEASLQGMHSVTQRFSAEFAIRPFLQRYPHEVFDRLQTWSTDESLHVRRLVSEGTRPRLPWGARLPVYLEAPTDIMSILNVLRKDPELYVRRSVANHLNDLTKDHPELVLDIVDGWKKEGDAHTDWVIKHALRSLIKAGNPRALKLMGFEPAEVAVKEFTVSPPEIALGDSVDMNLSIQNKDKKEASFAVDFVVHYMKSNGKTAPKVFKWAAPTLKAGETISFTKKLLLVHRTTRKLYPGEHRIEVQINGERYAEQGFVLGGF
ncbi:MAG: DNA alkylation repair protein [Bacteroidia bacterium]